MSHFDAMYSLDGGQANMFMDPLTGGMGITNPVSFEFDNFGMSHQPAALSQQQLLPAVKTDSTSSQLQPPTLLQTSTEGHSPSAVNHTQTNLNHESHSQMYHQPHSVSHSHAQVLPQPLNDSNISSADGHVKSELPVAEQVNSELAIAEAEAAPGAEGPTIDIAINNVVCSFATRCHLNLRKIAMEGMHVIHKKENGMVSMKLRRPYTTASIWSSGKITCTGATSEDASKLAARRFSRILQKLGFKTRVANFRVVNVLGTCSLPFGINIAAFSRLHPREASYEPELHPGVTYRLKEPKATLKIFSTGSITITAPRVANVQAAIEHIFPLVYEHRKNMAELEKMDFQQAQMYMKPANRKKRQQAERQRNLVYKRQRFDDTDEEDWTDTDEDYSDDSEYGAIGL